jgi:hypothetical protein
MMRFIPLLLACSAVGPTETQAALDVCDNAAQFELAGVGGANFNTLYVDTAILPMSQVGRVLANDQIHMLRMANQQGLHVLNKHVPAFVIFGPDGNVVTVHAGGFYQCATLGDCQHYLTDVVGQYRLDGTLFNDRPEFHHSFQGHAYQVIGGAQFQDIPSDYAIKVTRWQVTNPNIDPSGMLHGLWQSGRQTACQRGTLAQAFLLWSPDERVVAEVTIGDRIDGMPYFISTLGALASQPVLDPVLDNLPWLSRIPPPVTDTYLVLTYWPGAFDPSRWPNSLSQGGPLPEPFCGDGSCNTTINNVENAANCPADCAPTCGNGACDPGESADTCAVDCLP